MAFVTVAQCGTGLLEGRATIETLDEAVEVTPKATARVVLR